MGIIKHLQSGCLYKDVYQSIVSNSGKIGDSLIKCLSERLLNKSCYSHAVEYRAAIKMIL